MSIDKKEVESIIRSHRVYVDTNRKKWDDYRAAYEDDFWRTQKKLLGKGIFTQVNLTRFYIDGFVAGLFYKGLHPVVRADDVSQGKAEDLFKGYEPGEPQRALEALLYRFLNEQNADVLSDHAFTTALMYPEIALKVGIDERLGEDAVDQVWIDVLPPWECVWDRKNRNKKDMRYIGHMFWIPVEDFRSRFGSKVDDKEVEAVVRPDVPTDGMRSTTEHDEPDGDSVCVLEFYDFTDMFVDEDNDADGEGVQRFYMVSVSEKGGTTLSELQTEAVPYTTSAGRPLAPIMPVVLLSVPEHPLRGIAAAASIYEINKERNFISTLLARAIRRDTQRVLMLQKDAWDEDTIAALKSGDDNIVVEIEHETLDGIARWLEQQGLSSTVMQYLNVLRDNQTETSGVSELTRGKSLQYATATEVAALNDYTESTLGRLRKNMDSVISTLCSVYLRVLRAAVGDKDIRIRMGPKFKDFSPEFLDLRWDITMTDLANTPLAEAQKRGDFSAASPMLMEQLQLATGEDPVIARAAQHQIDYIVRIYDLPEELSWRQLSQVQTDDQKDKELAPLVEQPPPEQPPPADMGALLPPGLPPEAAPLPPAGQDLTPEDISALLQDPEIMAMVQQALAGGGA